MLYRFVVRMRDGSSVYVDAYYYMILDDVLHFYLRNEEEPFQSFNSDVWATVERIGR